MADVIIGPLPEFEQNHLGKEDCALGTQWLNEVNPIKDLTIVSGRTGRGARALSQGVTKYMVYGFGEGIVGAGASSNDWGTAFKVSAQEYSDN